MKRLAALILLLLYFATSTGATIHYHYCMGEVANISLWANEEKKCGRCGMEKKETTDNGCCKDEREWIKIDDDQKASAAHFEMSKLQFDSINIVLINSDVFTSQVNYSFPESKALLRSCEIATYLLNCVFRI